MAAGMTREQWEALARFAGIDTRHWNGSAFVLARGVYATEWQPLTDWNDFGPLWVKLTRYTKPYTSEEQWSAHKAFFDAKMKGAESELMKAGCELAAAIGATMKQEPAIAGKQ